MKILLTNDDGIEAPGLAALANALQGELVIVAPAQAMSECSHQVTTRDPLKVERRNDRKYAIHGTPADCVRMALTCLLQGWRPDWILSGINLGGNLGVDVYISGTVAAAREAAIHGIPAIAFSHYRKKNLDVEWDAATRRVQSAFTLLKEKDRPVHSFWNVNLPHLLSGEPDPEIRFCTPSLRSLPIRYILENGAYRYAGVYAQRDKEAGTDVEICFNGQTAASLISL